ncbi:ABC transporter permease [Staphylospora marina]|uniref:ABC transporter permease n=1 Tax=Staphylospora marina TaxID=2490858 RepID=UPI000F5C031D|nr:ABC transporter permease [Staphylospora marina]
MNADKQGRRSRANARFRRYWQGGWPPFLLGMILLTVWETAVRKGWVEAWLLPAPSTVGKEFIASAERMWPDLLSTATVALTGLAAGVAAGAVFASLLHLSRLLRAALYPLIVLSQNIPLIVLAPLLVMWMGFGDEPKALIAALVCFFPVTVAVLDGFRRTDPVLISYMRMAGASRWQLFFLLEWPSALPSFFSGAKLSAAYSVMGAVIAEWLGAERGLGMIMQLAASSFRTDRVFVATLWVILLSLLLFFAMGWLERLAVRGKAGGDAG